MHKTSQETIDLLMGAKQPRISGREARSYVQQRKPFRNSNNQLHAYWLNGSPLYENAGLRYVVYSYGDHWPLHIWDDATLQWYSNADKYGPTSSKHYTQTHPHCDTVPLSVKAMQALAFHGYAGLAQLRLEGMRFG